MTANPRQGWQVRAVPELNLYRTEAGRFALPLLVEHDGQQVAEVALVLTGGDIEGLHISMRNLVADGVPAPTSPSATEARRIRRASLFDG